MLYSNISILYELLVIVIVLTISTMWLLSVDDEAGTAESLGKSDVVMNHRVTWVVERAE
jgi:hypothetical protein